MRKSAEFNFIAIGAGSAGLVASYLGAALKARVALIERKKMGGDCLNTGCVPSKALLRTAKVLALRNKARELGLKSLTAEFEFADVMERVQRVIRTIEPHDSMERYRGLGVTCFEGEARLLSAREVKVNDRILTTRAVVVASGAKPFVPPIPGLAEIEPLTSDTIWELRALPKRLLVLGGGAVGCEMAQAFQRLGAEVTLLERNDRLLAKEDKEVGEHVVNRFRAEGIRVLLSSEAKSFRAGVAVAESPEGAVEIPFDRVLVALGRKANVSGFGLEELGVRLRKDGTLEADSFLATNVPGIYACGDVTGPYQFTHFASLTGSVAARNALFHPFRVKADYSVFPWAMYTEPEVARVGLNETQADSSRIDVTIFDLKRLDRIVTEDETGGFIKILTQKGRDKILGATIVGPHAGELVQEFALAMQFGIGMKKLLGVVHAYPSFIEANRLAVGAWARSQSPAWALRILERFHRARRLTGI